MQVNSTLKKLNGFLQSQFAKAESIVIPFSIFCLILYTLFYPINVLLYGNNNQYDSITLRLIFSLIYGILIFKKHWPSALRRYLPLYWYLSILFGMPFFFTFMALKNHLAASWILSLLAKIILMILLVDWISYTFLLTAGVLIAWIVFILTSPQGFVFEPGEITIADILSTFITSIIVGIIFSWKKAIYQDTELAAEKARSDSMRLVGASIAHELRTPLQSIKLLTQGIKNYLPTLTETYRLAQEHQLDIPHIQQKHLKTLERSANSISLQINHSMVVIDSLLNNISISKIEHAKFQVHSITECVNIALMTYPFMPEQRQLVTWDDHNNFHFLGSANLIVQVLFNLLKNALYSISATGHGEIYISVETGNTHNTLYFEDKAQGIPEDALPHIFERFFTKNTRHGTGIGLAFCKMCMQKHGGDIKCESEYGKYTRFILRFPKLGLE